MIATLWALVWLTGLLALALAMTSHRATPTLATVARACVPVWVAAGLAAAPWLLWVWA